MGIADAVKAKAKVVTPGIPVATVVRSGEAEIGFQQVSELIHEKGIDFLGPLPAEIQRITIFSGGIHTQAKEPAAAKALQSFLTAPERAPDLKKHGLSPG
jgi:molybdate transport system substrate-binding protein